MTDSNNMVNNKVTPWRCLVGATVSGSVAIAIYFLTASIAHVYANKPITFTNPFAIKIAVVVRTVVVGLAALGTGVFGIVSLGLILLAMQLIWQKITNQNISDN